MLTKVFTSRNFIFNNGIVNFALFLEKKPLEKKSFDGVKYKLYRNKMILEVEADEKFYEIFEAFIKDYQIVYLTNNKRWYFDKNRMDFIYDYKFDTKGGQKNDLRNGAYLYKSLSDLGIDKDQLKILAENFVKRLGLNEKKAKSIKEDILKRNKLIIAITLDEAIRRFARYMVKDDKLPIDSKIHTFEDGQESFHDLLKKPKYNIDKWEALVYWFGGRTGRYFYLNYFLFPNSANLKALYELKRRLKISENPIEITTEDGIRTQLPTNIDFYHQLQKDGITNINFYISKSPQELELKFFLYLFSVIYHIEDEYHRADERRRKLREALFQAVQEISFVVYAEENEMKSALNEYTKAYRLMRYFESLKKEKIEKDRDLFWYLSQFLTVVALARTTKEVNKELEQIATAILEFQDFRKPIFHISYAILNNDASWFGKELFRFIANYIQTNLKGDKMNLHLDAKIVGEGIGLFCANLENKDLLFKLRNVKNFKQLVTFCKEVKFEALRHPDAAMFSNDFQEALERILQNEKDWELARDYIAIYAIDKFRSVMYARNHQ